jgi:hypothetical protein
MRLLNATTFQVEQNWAAEISYAILSHTWEVEEVTFQDLYPTPKADWQNKRGFLKIKHACEQALRDGYEYVWVDTCCINKEYVCYETAKWRSIQKHPSTADTPHRSSAELSEAINSMFRWYQDASICYAYLSDASSGDDSSISSSRWFTRGWCLQELIAPDHVHFYDAAWAYIGSRISLASKIQEITGVDESILTRGHVDDATSIDMSRRNGSGTYLYTCRYCSARIWVNVQRILGSLTIAERMRWASKRQTTRLEDIAYSLMGLFDVNIPLLYGEGTKAFSRLQEAILRGSDDHSILAFRAIPPQLSDGWSLSGVAPHRASVLAPDPAHFQDAIQREWAVTERRKKISFVDGELTLDLYICPLRPSRTSLELFANKYIGILDCVIGQDYLARPAILLARTHGGEQTYNRCPGNPVLLRVEAGHADFDQALASCTLINSYEDQGMIDISQKENLLGW